MLSSRSSLVSLQCIIMGCSRHPELQCKGHTPAGSVGQTLMCEIYIGCVEDV